MGFDCNLFFEQTVSAIGQMGYSAEEAGHAIGELSKALNKYNHVVGCDNSSLSRSPVRPSAIICASIVRKSGLSSLPERQAAN